MIETIKLFYADLKNLLRIKWLWFYLLSLVGGTFLFLYMSDDLAKVVLSLLNVTLLIVPLVTAFFAITYFYDSRNFMKFLLTQPVSRKSVFLGKFFSLSSFMSMLYLLGVTTPLLGRLLGSEDRGLLVTLIVAGALLSFLFSSLAFLVGVVFEDRAKGVSFLLGLWLYLALLHDGLILTVIYVFREYPLERVVLVLTLLNPVDLARLFVVLNLDIAALMGVSGAIFKEFFGSGIGMLVVAVSMLVWIAVPTALSLFLFKKKDL